MPPFPQSRGLHDTGPSLLEHSTNVFVSHLNTPLSTHALRLHLEYCEQVFWKRRAFVHIFAGGFTETEGTSLRELHASWLNRNRTLLENRCLAMAYVLSSTEEHGTLAATHFLAPPAYFFRIFSELSSAVTWAQGQFPSESARREQVETLRPGQLANAQLSVAPQSRKRRRDLPNVVEESALEETTLEGAPTERPGRYALSGR